MVRIILFARVMAAVETLLPVANPELPKNAISRRAERRLGGTPADVVAVDERDVAPTPAEIPKPRRRRRCPSSALALASRPERVPSSQPNLWHASLRVSPSR